MWCVSVAPSLTSGFVTSVTTATRMKLSPPSSKLLDLYLELIINYLMVLILIEITWVPTNDVADHNQSLHFSSL